MRISIFLLLFTSLQALDYSYWYHFKDRFVEDSGRVIDKYNGVSHSESQSYGMYFAVEYGDKETFDNIYNWTNNNLIKNKDGLYGWKWGAREDGSWGMIDGNNATDGDMWVAYALLLAYEKWGEKRYLNDAKGLMYNIKEYTVIQIQGDTFLLPGSYGFNKDDYIKLNPGYYIPFIFEKFYVYDHDQIWKNLVSDTVDMYNRTTLSQLKVHPNWINYNLNSREYEAIDGESIFGFDSIRAPLFLAYYYRKNGNREVLSALNGYKTLIAYIKNSKKIIYEIELQREKIKYKYPPFGFVVVYNYLYETLNIKPPNCFKTKIEKGVKYEQKDYYSFSLLLFSDIFQ
jgi:endoglucanase